MAFLVFAENAADATHLESVHSPLEFSGSDLRYTRTKLSTFLRHAITPTWDLNPYANLCITFQIHSRWSPSETDKHIAIIKISHDSKSKFFKIFPNDLTIQQIGPAYVQVGTHRFECAQCVKILNSWHIFCTTVSEHKWKNVSVTTFIIFSATLAIFIWANYWNSFYHSSRAIRPKACPKILCTKIHEWTGEIIYHRAICSGRKGHYDLEL